MVKKFKKNQLALFGGKKIRNKSMPFRKAFGSEEIRSLKNTINYYKKNKIDPKYKGIYEKKFCRNYSNYIGEGDTVAVSTGSAAVFIALQSLSLPKNAEVIISPFFEPGPLGSLYFLGFNPIVADSEYGKLNCDYEQIAKKITKKTKAVILVHSAGEPAKVDEISKKLKEKKIKLIEDCSQASGGSFKKIKLGNFGEISAISTMFSKNLMTGGSGGLVYTKYKKYIKKIIAYSDRGKPIWKKNFESRDPSQFLYPAMNWNSNEFSSSVGIASLKRLDVSVKKRMLFIKKLTKNLKEKSKVCRCYSFDKGSAPYFLPIWVDTNKINCSKVIFAKAVQSEGINLNPNYKFLCNDWVWAKSLFKKKIRIPNAEFIRNNSFNLFLNENYSSKEIKDIVAAILKVENYFLKIN